MTSFGEEAAELIERLRSLVAAAPAGTEAGGAGPDAPEPGALGRAAGGAGGAGGAGAAGAAAGGGIGPDEIRRIIGPELERLLRKGQLGGVGGSLIGGRPERRRNG